MRGWLTLRRLLLTASSLVALAAVCGLVGTSPATMAAKRPPTVKPGKHPAQVDARHLPVRGGAPSPEGLGYAPVGDRCRGRAQPGTISLRRYIDHWFHGHSLGIYNCRNVAGTNHLSTHAEGRALDWALECHRPESAPGGAPDNPLLPQEGLARKAARDGAPLGDRGDHLQRAPLERHPRPARDGDPAETPAATTSTTCTSSRTGAAPSARLSAWSGWTYRGSGM